MASESSYQFGRWLGKNWHVVALVVAGLATISALTPSTPTEPIKPKQTDPPILNPDQVAAMRAEELRKKCTDGLQAVAAQARHEMQTGSPERGFETLNECRAHITDPDTKALHANALVAARAKAEVEARKTAAAEKARKKREGVSVGMSQQDVLESNWGKPRRVNRTTTAHGVSEQWVYDGGYLYFDDGILRAIQN